jgi:hypothetical protein
MGKKNHFLMIYFMFYMVLCGFVFGSRFGLAKIIGSKFQLTFEGNIMNIKRVFAVAVTAFVVSSAAYADGFSATLDVPIVPTNQFSVRLGLNYSLEVTKNLFIGASLNPSFTPSNTNQFGLTARVGAKYVVLIAKSAESIFNGYVGAGATANILPQPFGISADINAGLDGVFGLGAGFKLYTELNGKAGYDFTASVFGYQVDATLGIFVEPIQNLEFRLQGSGGILGIANTSNFFWLASSSLYYTIVPQFKLGVTAAYGSSGAFVFGLGALFAEKPGTLGIAGNYLP